MWFVCFVVSWCSLDVLGLVIGGLGCLFDGFVVLDVCVSYLRWLGDCLIVTFVYVWFVFRLGLLMYCFTSCSFGWFGGYLVG